jgi:hypothetical protein
MRCAVDKQNIDSSLAWDSSIGVEMVTARNWLIKGLVPVFFLLSRFSRSLPNLISSWDLSDRPFSLINLSALINRSAASPGTPASFHPDLPGGEIG